MHGSTSALAGVRTLDGRSLYDVWYRAAAGPPTEAELAAATPVPLAIREHPIPNDVLERRQLRPEGMEVALTTEAVLHIRHWSHLVVANYVALFCRWFDLTPGKVLRYLGAAVRAGWPSRYRLMRALTIRGRRCDVHPSAVVEASVLGDGVEIGPCAVVRGSVLGDRVKVDAHANVNYSSLGDRSMVSFHAACNLSVLYPEAMLGEMGAQMAVLGRRATVFAGAFLMDLRDPYLERDVLVDDGGRRVPSGRRLLGPCIGHDAVIAAGVRVAPGLVVPPGAYLVGDPGDVMRRIEGPLEPREPHAAVDGRATPLRKG
jgi:carbonic anhydrase/acetyltransferase-like protein (isoleucine patch superfamily)